MKGWDPGSASVSPGFQRRDSERLYAKGAGILTWYDVTTEVLRKHNLLEPPLAHLHAIQDQRKRPTHQSEDQKRDGGGQQQAAAEVEGPRGLSQRLALAVDAEVPGDDPGGNYEREQDRGYLNPELPPPPEPVRHHPAQRCARCRSEAVHDVQVALVRAPTSGHVHVSGQPLLGI